ncbi:uncharacterized protein LOC108026563 [Drosophila biarmipes]|uniref:uncharacterized protein LOC108026563 n=1 Tax=Drosophila biarmipes TaxID=125945 RepID=UPI0007E6E3DF|nr:uncharacterized protein LOC108026563 [Drosophila biarmipes]
MHIHSYGVLQGVLLGATSIIILWVQGLVGLPLALPDRESLPIAMAEDLPAERAPRQINLNQSATDVFNTQTPHKYDGFRVFGKKLQEDYHRKTGYDATHAPLPIAATKQTTPGPKESPKSAIRLYADPQEGEAGGGEEGGETTEGGAEGGEGSGGGAVEAGGGGNETGKELTVSIEKFQTNQYGDKVYNPWGITFGHQFLDTRFGPGSGQIALLSVNPHPIQNYYPSVENLTTVCLNRSTIYNDIKIEKWLMRYVYSRKKKVRPFFFALRQQLYEKGDSEQCHQESFSDWLQYQECAIRRNQRMEYFIPKYPRHQLATN